MSHYKFSLCPEKNSVACATVKIPQFRGVYRLSGQLQTEQACVKDGEAALPVSQKQGAFERRPDTFAKNLVAGGMKQRIVCIDALTPIREEYMLSGGGKSKPARSW